MTTLQHKFQEEIFIPYGAVNDQEGFFTTDRPVITTQDDIIARVVERRGFNILSDEAKQTIWRLYELTWDRYLRLWYGRIPDMHSMYFLYLKLEKIENDTTQSVPEEN